MIDKPTKNEIRNCYIEEDDTDIELISDKFAGNWRHGNINEVIFKRKKDETYWRVMNHHQSDGEYNYIRDDLSDENIVQVIPEKKMVEIIKWKLIK